jgi:hypothetical protein
MVGQGHRPPHLVSRATAPASARSPPRRASGCVASIQEAPPPSGQASSAVLLLRFGFGVLVSGREPEGAEAANVKGHARAGTNGSVAEVVRSVAVGGSGTTVFLPPHEKPSGLGRRGCRGEESVIAGYRKSGVAGRSGGGGGLSDRRGEVVGVRDRRQSGSQSVDQIVEKPSS